MHHIVQRDGSMITGKPNESWRRMLKLFEKISLWQIVYGILMKCLSKYLSHVFGCILSPSYAADFNSNSHVNSGGELCRQLWGANYLFCIQENAIRFRRTRSSFSVHFLQKNFTSHFSPSQQQLILIRRFILTQLLTCLKFTHNVEHRWWKVFGAATARHSVVPRRTSNCVNWQHVNPGPFVAGAHLPPLVAILIIKYGRAHNHLNGVIIICTTLHLEAWLVSSTFHVRHKKYKFSGFW